MNRKERRLVSKRLGIMGYQQKLPLKKKFNLIRENIIAGKKREQEVAEEVRRVQNLSQDERDSENIQFLAENIAREKKIPVLDALEEAQKKYYKGRK